MKRRARGFSLLEVIAAVMLLAIVFAALMQVAGGSLNQTARASSRSQAALWAQSKMETLGRLEPLQGGHSEGRFDATYRWQLEVTPWDAVPADDPGLRLYKLDLDVLWGEGAQTHTLRFVSLRIPEVPREPVSGDQP